MLPALANQFIADTYHGVLHTANQPLSGGYQTVYDGMGNPSALQLSVAGAMVSNLRVGNLNIPTSAGSGGQLLGVVNNDLGFVDLPPPPPSPFPVGSVFFTAINTNPGGFLDGTWISIGQGRFIVGVGTGTDDFGRTRAFGAGSNNGEYEHQLSIAEMPAHTHGYKNEYRGATRNRAWFEPRAGEAIAQTEPTGGDMAHENTPPSIGLYIWQRTS